MNLRELKHLATLEPSKGHIRAWRAAPGDYNRAIRAALQTANRVKAPMVVIPGNSYGHRVFHIARENEFISKYAPGCWPCKVLFVKQTGEVYSAMAYD